KISTVKWSPKDDYLSYLTQFPSGNAFIYELWVVKPDGTAKSKIDGDSFQISDISWSPDGSRFAYSFYDANLGARKLRVAFPSGSKTDVYEVNGFLGYIEWVNNDEILLLERGSSGTNRVLLVPVEGSSNPTILHEAVQLDVESISLSPDRQHVAFTITDWQLEKKYVYLSDLSGNIFASEFNLDSEPGCRPLEIHPIWTPNGNQIAFIEGVVGDLELGDGLCAERFSELVIMDQNTQEKTVMPLSSPLPVALDTCLSDAVSCIGFTYGSQAGTDAILLINTSNGELSPVLSNIKTFDPDNQLQIVSPEENYLVYDQGGSISTTHSLRSLVNLTAELNVSTDRSILTLMGAAQDLYFDRYVLEYADIQTPETWQLISVPSEVPVVNGVFADWIPPYEGTFLVRLTVWDKAGNKASDIKRVSWDRFSSITNIYKSTDIFSPNGDGVLDTLELNYAVREPVHLEFFIYDADQQLIKTIPKDHPTPEQDSIVWDGKNDNGDLVSDGKYTLGVFEFEFTIEVDVTPPEVDVYIDPISQHSDHRLYVDLQGYAYDKHLKSWTLESGFGSNPQEWQQVDNGNDILVATDELGDPLLDPIEGERIRRFFENAIEDTIVGKRFRITAVDAAGNRATRLADFLPQELIFYKWDDESFAIDPGRITNQHREIPVGVLESVIDPLETMTIQYSNDRGTTWNTSLSMNDPISGKVEILWDTSQLDPPFWSHYVRILATDIVGKEYYSNVGVMNALEMNVECSGVGAFNGIGNLSILKFQIQSDGDSRYSSWSDLKVYDVDSGNIPSGEFNPDLDLSMLLTGVSYELKILGITPEGEVFESERSSYPPRQCPQLLLEIEYAEAVGCDQIAPGEATLIAKTRGIAGNEVTKRTLTYSIADLDGNVDMLRQLDLSDLYQQNEDFTVENTFDYLLIRTVVNTNAFGEHIYPVEAVLEIETVINNTPRKDRISANGELFVDRQLPTTLITYPTESLLVCPVEFSESGEVFNGIPLEGIVADDTRIKRYTVFPGNITGEKPIEGQLGLLNLADLTEPFPSIQLSVVDIAGNTGCFSTNFSVDASVEIANVSVMPDLFSPDGDGVEDEVQVSYEINEFAVVDVEVYALHRDDNGTYDLTGQPLRIIASGLQHLGGDGMAVWHGMDDSGATV
ncbi:MAG: hypothetical protein OEQ53_16010, partial [Saprospiraceae bacterium]|nr:hypothetical protein [Saprospiraceae bacterium]